MSEIAGGRPIAGRVLSAALLERGRVRCGGGQGCGTGAAN